MTYSTILTAETIELKPYDLLTSEQVVIEATPISTKRILPTAPFPRKYVHSVFVDLQDAIQAAQALRSAGFNERDIYVLESHDFVEAVSQGHSPMDFLTSTDYDVYLHQAKRGHAFLAVRPTGYSQLEKIRRLLAPHHARHAKYIDTWTVADLLP